MLELFVQPLRVAGIDAGMVSSIEKVLCSKSEQENELRTLFVSPLHCVDATVSQLLSDYRSQRFIGTLCDLVVFC